MGRIEKRPNNNAIDVPWDHYTFDLGGHTDLQPQLRKKVEIIETEVGFCMLYPKHRRRKGQQKNNNARVASEGRGATLNRDATWDSLENSPVQKNRRTVSPHPSPKQKQTESTAYYDGTKDITRILGLEGNTGQLLQCAYSSRSCRC